MTEPLTDEQLWGCKPPPRTNVDGYCVVKQRHCMYAPEGECVRPDDPPCETLKEPGQ